jgi:hypothetical protein
MWNISVLLPYYAIPAVLNNHNVVYFLKIAKISKSTLSSSSRYGVVRRVGTNVSEDHIASNVRAEDGKSIVTCMTIARQRLCKHILRQRIRRQQSNNFHCYATAL